MTIKQTLIDNGLYSPKLDHQIALATKLKAECDTLRRQIKDTGYLIQGPKSQIANPLIASLQKAEALLQSAYTALGLTYTLRKENLPPPPVKDALDDLMSDL